MFRFVLALRLLLHVRIDGGPAFGHGRIHRVYQRQVFDIPLKRHGRVPRAGSPDEMRKVPSRGSTLAVKEVASSGTTRTRLEVFRYEAVLRVCT